MKICHRCGSRIVLEGENLCEFCMIQFSRTPIGRYKKRYYDGEHYSGGEKVFGSVSFHRMFVLFKEDGGPRIIDSAKRPPVFWRDFNSWTQEEKEQEIVVFEYIRPVMFDIHEYEIGITTKENFAKIGSEEFNLDKISRIMPCGSFLSAKTYLARCGFNIDKIFEENSNEDKVYSNLGHHE